MGLQSITSVVCTCSCGWVGTVVQCRPDVDGDGSLGCPECGTVVVVIGPEKGVHVTDA